jgi:hypothetical protein
MTSIKLLFMPDHSAISFYRMIESMSDGVQWENSNKYDGVEKSVYEILITKTQYDTGVQKARELVGQEISHDELMKNILVEMFPDAGIDASKDIAEEVKRIWKESLVEPIPEEPQYKSIKTAKLK